jgi:putative ABC transport system permease protein
MRTLLAEIRNALRVLARNRTTTLVSMVTLALAIGATTAIFTVAHGLLLRRLPYPDPDRLVQVARQFDDDVSSSVSIPLFVAWGALEGGAFTGLAAYERLGGGFNLVGAGPPDRIAGSRVSAAFFTVLGVHPAIGRGFTAAEDVPGGPRVVMLSHTLWVDRFGGDRGIVGRAIRLNGEPHTVVGVMPPEFRFPDTARLWTPFQLDRASTSPANYFEVVGRLRPGTSLEQGRAAASVVFQAIKHLKLETNDGMRGIAVRPLQELLYGSLRPVLLVLLAAVGFVLLIACVNVANLQLAQAGDRRHEIALRTALGGSAWAIARQLLIENLTLGLAGGLAGLSLAYATLPILVALAPFPPGAADTIAIDARILAFALGTSLLSALAFGTMPALQATRPELETVLRAGSRRSAGRAGRWTRRVLVTTEVALALVLTVGASLLVKSLLELYGRQPGFTVEHVITMKMSLPEARYAGGEALGRFATQVEERLRAVPGVRSAAVANSLPLELGAEFPFTIEGKYVPKTETGVGNAKYRASGPGYFEALRIGLRDGRLFDARDRRGSLPVAVINEAAARRYFKGERAIGQRITLGQPFVPELADPSPREIVGIVADVREDSLREDPPAIVYLPVTQQNDGLSTLLIRLLPYSIVVRSTGEIAGLTPALQRAVWEVDPEQPVTHIRTMQDIVVGSLGSARFNALLLASLAVLALVLAAAGLYGLIAHMVGQETRSIGVRMALGSTPGAVVGLFLRQAAWLVAAGSVIGLAAAYGVTRFLQSLLTGVSATDPWVFAAAPAGMLVVALIAVLRPAMQASRVDPVEALRAE